MSDLSSKRGGTKNVIQYIITFLAQNYGNYQFCKIWRYDEFSTHLCHQFNTTVWKTSPSNTDVNKFTQIIDNDKNQLIYSKYYGNTYHKLSFNHKINSMFSLYRKRNITEIMFWSHYKIWKWRQEALLSLIFDKINNLTNYSYVLKIRPGEATYVQRNSVTCFATVLHLKQNKVLLLYCWATRYCKPHRNTNYSTTML